MNLRMPVVLILVSIACVGMGYAQEQPSPQTHTLSLNRASQVEVGLHHWRGPQDASLDMEAKVDDDALIITCTLVDDVPFLQPRRTKINPFWWKMEYGADGVRFILRKKNDLEEIRCDFYLDFSSQAIEPRIVIVESETNIQGSLQGSRLKFVRRLDETRFLLHIPLNQILKEPLSLDGNSLEVRLYDLDGDHDEYTILSDSIDL